MWCFRSTKEAWRGWLRGVEEIKMKVTSEPGLERQMADCWFQSYQTQGKWMPLEQKAGSLPGAPWDRVLEAFSRLAERTPGGTEQWGPLDREQGTSDRTTEAKGPCQLTVCFVRR